MAALFDGDLHAGLSGLNLPEQRIELGQGIVLSKTYAHLMAPFMMAFKPAPKGGHHPAPWKAANGGFSFDISVELLVPHNLEKKFSSNVQVAKTILFLLRLGVNPATMLSVFANRSFASMPDLPNNEVKIFPVEVQPRYFSLGVADQEVTFEAIFWVRERWEVTHKLIQENAEFSLAVEALNSGQFVEKFALTLISLWGALEALFSPSTSELKFRVSSLIATFLESPGSDRHALQKDVAKLYDKRSAAAHGKPRHEVDDLLATFNLLRSVLIKIIDRGEVPSKEVLEGWLFGIASD
jgi:hypothetical protein